MPAPDFLSLRPALHLLAIVAEHIVILSVLLSESFPHNSRLASLPGQILVVNPSVSFLQTVMQRSVWLPVEVFLDQCVFAIASVYALRSSQIVIALQLYARDFLDDVHQLIDTHRLGGPQINGLHNF